MKDLLHHVKKTIHQELVAQLMKVCLDSEEVWFRAIYPEQAKQIQDQGVC